MRPASPSPRNTRRLLSLLLGFFLGLPLAAQSPALAAFRVNGRPAGDREFLLGAAGEVLLPSALVRELLGGLVRPELLEAVSGRERLVSAAELALVGILLDFNPDELRLSLRILPRAALPLELGRGEAARAAGGRVVGPEPLSLVLGFGLSLEPRYLPASAERPFRPYLDLNLAPALGFFGFIAEASLDLGWREEGYLRLGQARLIRDFPARGLRLAAGQLQTQAVSFQTAPALLGLALYREKSLPGAASSRPRLGLLELERPATLGFELNGQTVRRARLEPGAYWLSDLPLASGLNDLVVTIEEEGAEPRRIELGLPHEGGLLNPGELDWYLGGGFDEKAEGEAFGTARASYGLSRGASLGANLQAGYGAALGGLSLLWATPLGSFAAEGGLGANLEDFEGSLKPAGRLLWRYASLGKPFLPRLGLGLEYRAAGFRPPSPPSGLPAASMESLRLSAQLSQALPGRASLAAAVEARYAGPGLLDRVYCSLGLYQSLPGSAFLSLSAGLDLDAELNPDPSLSLSLSLNPPDRRALQYRHDFYGARDSIDLSIPLREGRESLGLRIDGLPAPDEEGLRELGASYRLSLPAAELGLSGSYRGYSGESAEWDASLAIRSALVLAGGRAALLPNPGSTLVLLAPGPSLGGQLLELRSAGGALLAASQGGKTGLGSGIRSYERLSARIEMPESPPELSVLEPELALEGVYRSVLVVRAEAARSLSLRGRLLLPGGEPGTGLFGEVYTASGLYAGADTFSDEEGYFYCYGLMPGAYTIRWSDGGLCSFAIPAEAGEEYDLGELRSRTATAVEEEE